MANRTLAAVLHHLRTLATAEAGRDLSDTELLERFRCRREETAFAILLQRHGPMVLGVCRRVLDNLQDAEDAFQATFLVLVRNASSIRKGQSLASWLYGVAQRVAIKARKQAASRRTREQHVTAMAHTESIDELTWQELRPILDQELAALPEKYRAPLVLRYLEGKSCEQVAQELGVARSTASDRMKQGLQLLRHRFAERGIELTAALVAIVLGQKTTAAVPALLTLTTVRSATLLLSRPVVASALVSARALGLAQGVTMSLTMNKAKIAAVFLLLAGALTASGVALLQRTADPSANQARTTPQPLSVAAGPQDPIRSPFVLTPRETTSVAMKKRPAFVAFTPASNTLAAVGPSGEVMPWNLATGEPGQPRQLPGGKVIGLSPDGSIAATANRNDVTIVEVATGRTIAQLQTAGEPPRESNPLAKYGATKPELFHPDRAFIAPGNRTVAFRCACNLEVWSLAGGRPQRLATPQQEGPFIAVAIARDGSRLAYLGPNRDEGLSVWDLARKKRTVHVPPLFNSGSPDQPNKPASSVTLNDVVFTADIKTVIAGGTSDYSWTDQLGQPKTDRVCWLRAWDVATGAEKYTREYRPVGKEDDGRIVTLGVCQQGILAAGSADGRVKLFDAALGRELGTVAAGGRPLAALLAPDANTLVVAGATVKQFELTKQPAPAGAPEAPDAWKPPAPEKLSAAGEAYQALVKEHQAWLDRAQKKYLTLTEDDQRRFADDPAVRVEINRQLRSFAGRFLELAEKNPEDPVAVQALFQAMTLIYGSEAEKAADRLTARLKAGDKNVAPLFDYLVGGVHPKSYLTFLRAFAEHGPTPEIRAVASFKLAKSFLAVAEVAKQLQADTSGKVAREWERELPEGAELVKQLRAENPKTLTTEAEKMLKVIAEKHASVAHPYLRTTLGDAARWELDDLRNPTFAIGETAPEIEGKDAESKSFKLSDYRSKVVVLTFSANWCNPCRAMYPHERKLVERLKNKPFALLSVNADGEKKTLEASVKKGEITWRCWWDGLDGPITKQWHIDAFPTVFVLDARGVIRFKHVQGDALDDAVNELLQEAQPK
jgi:RNA polymerase sigma factor (sigma-70 family)